MILKCLLFVASVCGVVSGNAISFAYLPPPSPAKINSTITTADNNTTMNSASDCNDSTLTHRYGEDGIHFDSERIPMMSHRQIDRVISQGIQQLTLDLDHVLGSGSNPSASRGIHSPPDNIVFSPLSIAGALALVLLGAGGRTYQELTQVLGLSNAGQLSDATDIHEEYSRILRRFEERPGVVTPAQVIAASGIFVQEGYPIRPRYYQLSQSLYKSDVINLDFVSRGYEALAAVNKWVDTKTRGRITNFLSEPPSSETRLLIASALYFNGAWEYPFPEKITSKRPFFVDGDAKSPGNETLEVTMMANSADLPFYASPTLGCRVLGLPYKGGEVTMYVVLPNKTGIDALRELEQKLTPSAIDELVMSTTIQSVIVLLPRMKLESTISLKDALKSLGVETLFNPLTADLSLISPGMPYYQQTDEYPFIVTRIGDNNSTGDEVNTSGNEVNAKTIRAVDKKDDMVFRQRRQSGNPGLYADDAIHRVEIEITETGTVASAATLLSITRDGSRPNFRADRPFLFFIRHEPTGLLLFWGSVIRPTPSTVKK